MNSENTFTGIVPINYRQVQFDGNAIEYTRIWVQNLLFTLLTLGLYSPWAKVRRMRYFYHHTVINGHRLRYTAEPWQILRGRVLALALFGLYFFATEFSQITAIAITALVVLLLPWLLHQSYRFKLRNTAYRGVYFRLEAPLGVFYQVFLPSIAFLFMPNLLAGMFVYESWWESGLFLGLAILPWIALPLILGMFQRKIQQHIWWGNQRVSVSGSTAGLIGGYIGHMVLAVLISFCIGIILFAQNTESIFVLGALGVLLITVPWLYLESYAMAAVQNSIWSKTRLNDVRFQCNLSGFGLFKLRLINFVLTLITLGLFQPAAKIRVARYRVAAILIEDASDRLIARQATRKAAGATGDSASELFDLDIAL
ncbi:MAG: DUF898 family protein [Gammaproteobacteria bacterium]|nr:DUF898 family protein [Gammaproteobacteria bacterium]